MEIEVKQSSGIYTKAFVQKVSEDGVQVVYENNWKASELVTFDKCRAVLSETKAPSNAQHFQSNDIIEAFIKQTGYSDLCGWQKVKVREIKGSFAVVESIEEPLNNDIVSFDRCRKLNSASQLSFANFKQCFIPVPEELRKYLSNPETHKDIVDLIKNIHIEYLGEENQLKITSFFNQAIKSVTILKDSFLNNAKQKMLLLQRKEEAKRMLSLNDQATNVVEEFTVAQELMGLAIGSHGINISNARKIEGIEDVIIDEAQRSTGICHFKILASTREAAEQARGLLEFLLSPVSVPRNMVGQIIGKAGHTIQEIVDKSGVVRVQIGDENPGDMVDFIFTGTREAISNAALLIQYTLKHLKEMEEMREVVEEMQRKIYPPRNSPIAYSNGHMNGSGGAPRDGGPRPNGSNSNQSNSRFRGTGARASNSNGSNSRGFYSNKPNLNQQSKNSDKQPVETLPINNGDEKEAVKFESPRRDNREEGAQRRTNPRNRRSNNSKTTA